MKELLHLKITRIYRKMVEINNSNFNEKIPNTEDDESSCGNEYYGPLKRKSLFTISGVFMEFLLYKSG